MFTEQQLPLGAPNLKGELCYYEGSRLCMKYAFLYVNGLIINELLQILIRSKGTQSKLLSA